jgi:hypothetical protein
MFPMDLRNAVFTCTYGDGSIFETDDINSIGYRYQYFWVDDERCESITVDGVALEELEITGETISGRIIPFESINSVTFNINEGIYYIDSIPCQKAQIDKK